MLKPGFSFPLVALALLWTGVANSAEQRRSAVNGEVVALRAVNGAAATNLQVRRQATGKTESARAGSQLYPKDSLRTDANTIAQINFADGTVLVLGKNTELVLSEREETSQGTRTKLSLEQGLVRAKTFAAASRAGFQLHTKNAVVTHKGSATITSYGNNRTVVTELDPRSEVAGTIKAGSANLDNTGDFAIVENDGGFQTGHLDENALNALGDQAPQLTGGFTPGGGGGGGSGSTGGDGSGGGSGTGGGTFVGSGSGGGTFNITDQPKASP